MGHRVSSGTLSRLNQKIYRHIEAWRNRRIEGEFPYVYLDGVILKCSWAGEVRNASVLVAIGVDFAELVGKRMLDATPRSYRLHHSLTFLREKNSECQ
jgi:transposase-like protein